MRSRSAQFWLLCTLVAIAFVSRSMLEPLAPLYGHALGATPTVIGALVATAFLLPLFLAIPVGRAVDRWGARGFMLGGGVGLALAPLLVAAIPGLPALFAAQALLGLAQLAIVLAAQARVAAHGEGRVRERRFGIYTSVHSLGQLGGPLLAGLLADATTFRWAFAAAGAIAALVALGALALSARDAPRANAAAGSLGVSPREVGRLLTPPLRLAIGLSFVALFAVGAYTTLFPVYLEELAFSATAIGALMSLRALAAVAVRPLLPVIVAGMGGRLGAIVLVAGTLVAGSALVGVAPVAVALALASILLGAGWGLSQPLSMVMTLDHVATGDRGLALGVRLSANRAAQVASPLVFGLLAGAAGFGAAFLVSAAVVAVLGAMLVRGQLAVAFDRGEG